MTKGEVYTELSSRFQDMSDWLKANVGETSKSGVAIDHVSNSSLYSFCQCPNKFKLQRFDKILQVEKPKALRFGSLFHTMQEEYWECVQRGFDLEILKAFLSDACFGEMDKEKEKLSTFDDNQFPWFDKEEYLSNLQEEIDDCYLMTIQYAEDYYETDKEKYEVLEIEERMEFLVGDIKYVGIVDAVVRDKSSGAVYLVEHKTTADKNHEKYKSDLQYNPQPLGYCYWAREKYGDEFGGVIYNVVKKQVVSSPYVLKKKKNGNLLSVADTKLANVSEKTFLEAVIKHDPDNYDAKKKEVTSKEYKLVLEKLRNKVFRFRYHIFYDNELIDKWYTDRDELIGMITYCTSNNIFPKNYSACFSSFMPCVYRYYCHNHDNIDLGQLGFYVKEDE